MMKAKEVVPFCVRQGDVCLVEAAYRGDKSDQGELVKGARVVLQHGEVTGHAHVAEASPGVKVKPRLFEVQAERYLQVVQEATIRHEEHAPIILHEGRFQQAFQVEEQGEEVRRVVD